MFGMEVIIEPNDDGLGATTLRLTEYPKKVGLQPVKTPLSPSARPIFPHASKFPLYIFESTCRLHFTRSRGVTAV